MKSLRSELSVFGQLSADSWFRGQRRCWLGCNSSCVLELCFVFSRGVFGGGSWWGGHWGLVV